MGVTTLQTFNNVFRKNVLRMAFIILHKLRLLQCSDLCSHKEMERSKFYLRLEKQRNQNK